MRILFFFFLILIACQNQQQDTKTAAVVAQQEAVPPLDTIQYSKQELMGQFEPSQHPDFVVLGKPYTLKKGMRLRREAAEQFKEMYQAAKIDGIDLRIISSTRNFTYQKGIWERKWKKYTKSHPIAADRAKHILRYSSMPGTSRHHWGTDIDLNDLNNSSFQKGGKYAEVYTWLSEYASDYGFCQPYTPKGVERPEGYNEERWHWSYIPLANKMLQEYKKQMDVSDIQGFQGAETAAEVHAIEYFVKGVMCSRE